MSKDKPTTGNPQSTHSFKLSVKPWDNQAYTRDKFISDLSKVSKKSQGQKGK
jgi:hypothetical protein